MMNIESSQREYITQYLSLPDKDIKGLIDYRIAKRYKAFRAHCLAVLVFLTEIEPYENKQILEIVNKAIYEENKNIPERLKNYSINNKDLLKKYYNVLVADKLSSFTKQIYPAKWFLRGHCYLIFFEMRRFYQEKDEFYQKNNSKSFEDTLQKARERNQKALLQLIEWDKYWLRRPWINDLIIDYEHDSNFRKGLASAVKNRGRIPRMSSAKLRRNRFIEKYICQFMYLVAPNNTICDFVELEELAINPIHLFLSAWAGQDDIRSEIKNKIKKFESDPSIGKWTRYLKDMFEIGISERGYEENIIEFKAKYMKRARLK